MRPVSVKLLLLRATNCAVSIVPRYASSLMATYSYSSRSILEEALHTANNAVFFDNRHNYGDAMRAYGEAYALLGQVKKASLSEGDRAKLEDIVRVPHDSLKHARRQLILDSELPTSGASTSFKNSLVRQYPSSNQQPNEAISFLL